MLGSPRVHFRLIDSTNARARALALAGAPHGTLVTAAGQSAGRGRQGRTWTAPPGCGLLMSLILRSPPRLLPLVAGAAVAQTCGAKTQLKWPNDVLDADGRKLAGILVEGRPQEGWAVLGIGVNVAVSVDQLPPDVGLRAGTLGLAPAAVETVLAELLGHLEEGISASDEQVLEAVRGRDALRGRPVRWAGGAGTGAGIDGDGRLIVALQDGARVALDAGEVHLEG